MAFPFTRGRRRDGAEITRMNPSTVTFLAIVVMMRWQWLLALLCRCAFGQPRSKRVPVPRNTEESPAPHVTVDKSGVDRSVGRFAQHSNAPDKAIRLVRRIFPDVSLVQRGVVAPTAKGAFAARQIARKR